MLTEENGGAPGLALFETWDSTVMSILGFCLMVCYRISVIFHHNQPLTEITDFQLAQCDSVYPCAFVSNPKRGLCRRRPQTECRPTECPTGKAEC